MTIENQCVVYMWNLQFFNSTVFVLDYFYMSKSINSFNRDTQRTQESASRPELHPNDVRLHASLLHGQRLHGISRAAKRKSTVQDSPKIHQEILIEVIQDLIHTLLVLILCIHIYDTLTCIRQRWFWTQTESLATMFMNSTTVLIAAAVAQSVIVFTSRYSNLSRDRPKSQ